MTKDLYPVKELYPVPSVPSTDWKMAIEYSGKNSKFGCVLCEKTHFAKDCPNRVVKISAEKNYKSMYEKNEDDNVNYGW